MPALRPLHARRAGWAVPAAALASCLATGCGSAVTPPLRTIALPARPAIPAPVPSAEGPWPGLLGDAQHRATTGAPLPAGNVAWRVQLESPVLGGPVVGPGGVAYVATADGHLHAIDVADGHERWNYESGGALSTLGSVAPAVAPGGIVLFPAAGALIAVGDDGAEAWREPLGGQGLTPLVVGSRVYVTDAEAQLSAFDTQGRGKPVKRWQRTLGGKAHVGPVAALDGGILAAVDENLVRVDDLDTGPRLRWRFFTGETIPVPPAVAADGTILVSGNDPYLDGVRPDGTRKWRFFRGELATGAPSATADGLVYLGDRRGGVNVIDAGKGRLVARYQGEQPTGSDFAVGVATSVVVGLDHGAVFGTLAGRLRSVAADGSVRFDLDLGAAPSGEPAATETGLVLVATTAGQLIAVS